MWLYKGEKFNEEDIGDNVGFVYLIQNLKSNKNYIGKKLFKSTRTKTIKGKRKKVKSDSNWKSYWGSNSVLQEDVKILGEEHFRREILYLCKTKGTANYLELREQIDRRVLETDGWYNEQIYARIHRSHIKTFS
jgi:hypothetical protein